MEQDTPHATGRRDLLLAAVLGLVTVTVYWPVAHMGFINYDDPAYVAENHVVQAGLRPSTIAWAFTTGEASNWHPITWLSHALDCQLFGLNPGAHHMTNLALHVANTLLLFGLLRRLTGAAWRSALTAALFAWHPMHVESVAWLSERKDVLSGFFGLLTIWAYGSYAGNKGRRRGGYYGLAVVCFAVGLMCKPMLVSLPLIMLLLDYWPLKRLESKSRAAVEPAAPKLEGGTIRGLLLEKVPFVQLALIMCWVTMSVQKSGGAMGVVETTIGMRIGNAFWSYAAYVGKLLWPRDLAVLYPYPQSLPVGNVIFAGALLALITCGVLALLQRRPYLAVGWFWFLAMLVPVIGLVQVGEQSMADRYTYLPAIGLFVMIAWALPAWPGRLTAAKVAAVLAAMSVLAGLVALTARQLGYWRDSIALFTHCVEVMRYKTAGYVQLGKAYLAAGKPDQAMIDFERALELQPTDVGILNYKGMLLAQQGHPDEAITVLNQAMALRPGWYDTHRNLGDVYLAEGRRDQAIAQYRAAIELNPTDGRTMTDLGIALAREGHLDQAMEQYRQALKIGPSPVAENALGSALEARVENDEALRHFRAAVELDSDYAEAQNNLGTLLMLSGKLTEAHEHLRAAIKSDPDNPQAHGNLGSALAGEGRLKEAAAEFSEATRLDNDNLEAHYNFGNLLMRTGDWAAAEKQYGEVTRIKPGFADGQVCLGEALGHEGKDGPAIDHYRTALRLDAAEATAAIRLAWILATVSDASLRDGKEAIRLAVAARQQAPGDAAVWDVYAAAGAEAGQFAEAVNGAKKGIELAKSVGQNELAAQIQARLKLYEVGRPFHRTSTPEIK